MHHITVWQLPKKQQRRSSCSGGQFVLDSGKTCKLHFKGKKNALFFSIKTQTTLPKIFYLTKCRLFSLPCIALCLSIHIHAYIAISSNPSFLSWLSHKGNIPPSSTLWHIYSVLSLSFHLPMLKRAFVFQSQPGRVCLSLQKAFEKAPILQRQPLWHFMTH